MFASKEIFWSKEDIYKNIIVYYSPSIWFGLGWKYLQCFVVILLKQSIYKVKNISPGMEQISDTVTEFTSNASY